MRIGELAQRAGCQAETVRYYERAGLLKPVPRTDGNYRIYDEEALETLKFIRNCRGVGVELKEIARLLEIREQPDIACGEVNEVIDAQVERVRKTIDQLTTLKRHLLDIRSRCSGAGTAANCPILTSLALEDCLPDS